MIVTLLFLFVLWQGVFIFPSKAIRSGDWGYDVLSNGIVRITEYYGPEMADMVIPSQLDGHTITVVFVDVFSSCGYQMKTVFIPKTITGISGRVFSRCTQLEEIKVEAENPNYTTVDGVLYSKDKSILIKYPAGLAKTEFIIPDTVKSIEPCAYISAYRLQKITIPGSVEVIGYEAFSGSGNLKSVVMGYGVSVIETSAFRGCTNLSEMNIPDSVVEIGSNAFEVCRTLSNVVLPKNLKTPLGSGMFLNCSNLKTITLPDNMKIYSSTIGGCGRLENFIVNPENKIYSTVNGVLYSKDMTTLHLYPPGKPGNSYTVLEGTKNIEKDAFYGANQLTSVKIPEGVESLGAGAFHYSKLAQIELPWSLNRCGTFILMGSSNKVEIKCYKDSSAHKAVSSIYQASIYHGHVSFTFLNAIHLNESQVLLPKNETFQLKANTEIPEFKSKKIVWSSSDETVATISQNGLITANNYGIATITATAENTGQESICNVTVVKNSYSIAPPNSSSNGSSEVNPEKRKPSEKIDSSDVIDKIKSTESDKVEIKDSSSKTMTKKVFEEAAAGNKQLEFSVMENDKLKYSWLFDKDIDLDNAKDIDLHIDVLSANQVSYQTLIGDSTAIIIRFAHDGVLPAKATIKIDVGDTYKNGDVLYFYFYNSAANAFEEQKQTVVVEDGYATISITHCSDYIISETKLNSPTIFAEIESDPQKITSYFFMAVATILILLLLVVFVKIKKKKIKGTQEEGI